MSSHLDVHSPNQSDRLAAELTSTGVLSTPANCPHNASSPTNCLHNALWPAAGRRAPRAAVAQRHESIAGTARRRATVAITALAALLAAPSIVQGGMSNEIFVLTASAGGRSAQYKAYFADGLWTPSQQKLQWNLAAQTPIVAGDGTTLCTLRSASVTLRKHSRIQINFELDAGAADTAITIQSAYVWFPELSAGVALAQASGSFAATDLNSNSVTLVAQGAAGSGILRCDYNGIAPNGTLFSQLVGQIYAGAGGTASGSQSDPPSGYRSVGTAASSMSARIAFSLTAGDRASGSTNFRFSPEPTCTADADADGTPDCVDDCPADANKLGPGACGCGVADNDADADGVPDCDDGCPSDPLKSAPGACGCGVVDDANGDGVPDCGGGGGSGGSGDGSGSGSGGSTGGGGSSGGSGGDGSSTGGSGGSAGGSGSGGSGDSGDAGGTSGDGDDDDSTGIAPAGVPAAGTPNLAPEDADSADEDDDADARRDDIGASGDGADGDQADDSEFSGSSDDEDAPGADLLSELAPLLPASPCGGGIGLGLALSMAGLLSGGSLLRGDRRPGTTSRRIA